MEFEFAKGMLSFKKVLSDLDKLVFDFADMLKASGIKYVIVSGYVSILLGRTRVTEDIDILIKQINYRKFESFAKLLGKNGYWILNATTATEAFKMLNDCLAIRIAKKKVVIPNFEIKFAKGLEIVPLKKPLKVVINERDIFMSPLEIQIPFKLWLGSNKDIEDAMHIYSIFKDYLDKRLLAGFAKKLKVEKEMNKYGIK